jgi:hypothetical protein
MRGKPVRLRGPAEQLTKEGKGAAKWTRLPCRSFGANAVRLRASLNRGCGESGFLTLNPGDAEFVTRLAADGTA